MTPGDLSLGFSGADEVSALVAGVLSDSNGKLVHCVQADDAALVNGLVDSLPARIGPNMGNLAAATRYRTLVTYQGRPSVYGDDPTTVHRLGTDVVVGVKDIINVMRPNALPVVSGNSMGFAVSLPAGIFLNQINAGTSTWIASPDAYIAQRYRDNLTSDVQPTAARLCAYRCKLVDGNTYAKPRILSAVASSSNWRGYWSAFYGFNAALTDTEAANVQARLKAYYTLAA